MQERITPTSDDFGNLVVQYNKDLGTVGIGFDGPHDVPGQSLVRQVYGNPPMQTELGRIFAEMMKERRNVDVHAGYRNSNAEEVLNNQLGQFILEALVETNPMDGIFSWFDRPAINRLVRLLRTARDITFGKDE